MAIGEKGYELADAKDDKKSTRKRMRRKRKSCIWLCFSNMVVGSAVQEDGQEGMAERSAVDGLPVVSAFSRVDEKEKGALVSGNESCLLVCFSNLEVNTKGKPLDNK
ncbi:hypothetical protein BT93_L3622 [Corymbia citriodora subsp. variegata]|uniref:Uncharacterized protein n=1 Tax=Corymbia citriodora subsp. variegata TaxID=360336 RepID=A0A8T0CGZ2_CORYI|nr:hypothetical protein BT93_L3622 [Corymbia citriodora subsp. variegata]